MNRFYDTERNNINEYPELLRGYGPAMVTDDLEQDHFSTTHPATLQAAVDNLDEQLRTFYAVLLSALMDVVSLPFRYAALFVSSYLLLVIIIVSYQAFVR